MAITAKVDDKGRIRIPDAEPGQVLLVQGSKEAGWRLVPLKPGEVKPWNPFEGLTRMTPEECRQAWEVPDPEFDALAAHCASHQPPLDPSEYDK